MKVQLIRRIGVALVIALLASGADRVRSAGPGLGTSTAAPQGAPFSLPEGLVLESPVKSYSPENPVDCDDKYRKEANVSGESVTLCLIFNNTTDRAINVTLPPGLIFVSRDPDIQNGLLAQSYTIEVPAGGRYFAPILLYCANLPRSTSGVGQEYSLGPIIQYPAFKELFSILDGKEIVRRDTAAIQVAVTHLTDGEGLSASDRAALGAIVAAAEGRAGPHR